MKTTKYDIPHLDLQPEEAIASNTSQEENITFWTILLTIVSFKPNFMQNTIKSYFFPPINIYQNYCIQLNCKIQ